MKHLRICLAAFLLSFYLGVHKGNLAIWKAGSTVPLVKYPYSVNMFTEKDRTLLREGIPFYNSATLSKLLEDYMS